MPWTLFWTILAQVVITCFLLAIPVAFFVYMVGMQFYKIRPQVRLTSPAHPHEDRDIDLQPPLPQKHSDILWNQR